MILLIHINYHWQLRVGVSDKVGMWYYGFKDKLQRSDTELCKFWWWQYTVPPILGSWNVTLYNRGSSRFAPFTPAYVVASLRDCHSGNCWETSRLPNLSVESIVAVRQLFTLQVYLNTQCYIKIIDIQFVKYQFLFKCSRVHAIGMWTPWTPEHREHFEHREHRERHEHREHHEHLDAP